MAAVWNFIQRWGLSVLIMLLIFGFSSTPGNRLPDFGSLDFWVKKGGHMLGYGLLSTAYWRGLKWDKKKIWWAWSFAVLYAMTDEFHQIFVTGRHPSVFDVILFDATGAAVGLWINQAFFAPKSALNH